MGLDNPLHIAFLVVILLLVFGAKRLPEMGRSLGSGMREFKQSITGEGGQQTALSAPQQPQALAAPAQAAPPASAPQPAPAAQAVAAPAAAPEQAHAAEQQQA
jgi:sec-independent protein translocase protein TatA